MSFNCVSKLVCSVSIGHCQTQHLMYISDGEINIFLAKLFCIFLNFRQITEIAIS